ncbi:MAG TPA: LPS export ABC transporter periplasmic protein LptC [Firmicutes bacterium]|nr:LPS export ABC transporter periplasmic protein LptC [Bacillota bacterium]
MSRKSIIPVALAILGIACLIILLTVVPRRIAYEDAGEFTDSSSQVAGLDEKPGITAESAHFVGRSEGKKRWEFATDKVLIPDEDDWVELEGIRDGVFYDEGKVWMYFSAERARVNMNNDNLNLENVVFQSASGDSLSADTLTWDKNYDKVILEGDVRVRQGPSAILTCARAEYAPGDNILEAIGETVLEIEIQDD